MKLFSKSNGKRKRPIGKKRMRRRIIGCCLLVTLCVSTTLLLWPEGETAPEVTLPEETTEPVTPVAPTISTQEPPVEEEPDTQVETPDPEIPEEEEEEEEEPSPLPIYAPKSTDDLVAVHGLVDLAELDAGFVIELANASTDNVTGQVQYESNTALLLRSTAEALMKAQAIFVEDGYRIKLWDAYRPKSAQAAMNVSLPDELKYLIPYPGSTSQHCRGVAIDMTLVDENGDELDMPTDFCEFNDATAAYSTSVTPEQAANRDYMREVMTSVGFNILNMEWWHYYLPGHLNYELIDINFEEYAELKATNPSEVQFLAKSSAPLVSTVSEAISVDSLILLSDISEDFLYGSSSVIENSTKPCLLHADAINKLVMAQNAAMADGYRIKILDSYRPSSTQYTLTASSSGAMKTYLESTLAQSCGTTVDVVLVDPNGKVMAMPSAYMDLTADWTNATVEQLWNQQYLAKLMGDAGFEQVVSNGWWCFQLANSAAYDQRDVSYTDFQARYNAAYAQLNAPEEPEVTEPEVTEPAPVPEPEVTLEPEEEQSLDIPTDDEPPIQEEPPVTTETTEDTTT